MEGNGDTLPWWLSKTFISGLRTFDETYTEQVTDQPVWRHVVLVWMFEMTYFFNDYVCIFWFSTRSSLEYRTYVGAYITGLVLEVRRSEKRSDEL